MEKWKNRKKAARLIFFSNSALLYRTQPSDCIQWTFTQVQISNKNNRLGRFIRIHSLFISPPFFCLGLAFFLCIAFFPPLCYERLVLSIRSLFGFSFFLAIFLISLSSARQKAHFLIGFSCFFYSVNRFFFTFSDEFALHVYLELKNKNEKKT